MITKIRNLDFGAAPVVALAIRDTDDPGAAACAIDAGAHMLEFRIDHFARKTPEYVREVIQRFPDAPRLLTVRSQAEQGGWTDSEEARQALYLEILDLADAIDIEIQAPIRDALIEAAHAAKKTVLASFHDFDAMPAPEKLDALAAEARDAGADLIKIAAACHAIKDLRVLAKWTLDWQEHGPIAVGMGSAAALSRIFLPALGSAITYTFIGTPTAPGQLTCEETLRYLHTFYT